MARCDYYENEWARTREIFDGILAKGERSLPRVLKRHDRHRLRVDEIKIHGNFVEGDVRMTPFDEPFQKTVSMGENVLHLPLHANFLAIVSRWISAFHEPDMDCIVELGSGYGRNLFELYLNGGPHPVKMFAGEVTETGRALADELKVLEPALDITVVPFDYTQPDFSFLGKNRLKNVLFFTRHSIEQVERVPRELFTGMIAAAEKVTCLHFEPFGFQLNKESRYEGPISVEQEKFITRMHWNANLVESVQALADEGKLTLRHSYKNVIGEDPVSPTSIMVWTAGETSA